MPKNTGGTRCPTPDHIPFEEWRKHSGGLNPDLRRKRKWWNVLFDIPTPLPWHQQAPKPTLAAAIQRALSRH